MDRLTGDTSCVSSRTLEPLDVFQCFGRHTDTTSSIQSTERTRMALCKRAKHVKRWTLLALNGRHLGDVAEEEEPFRQFFISFLKQWRTRCYGSTSGRPRGSCRDGGGIAVSTWGGERGKQGTQRGQEVLHLVTLSFAGIARRFAYVTPGLISRVP